MEVSEISSRKLLELNKIPHHIKANEKIFALICATLLMLCAQRYINAQKFEGDAAGYWHYSSFIWNFSFPQAIRGYFYPLLLSPAKFIFESFPSTGYLALNLMQALVFSFTLTILLPYVFTRLIGGQVSLARRLIVPFLVAVFFPALIAYPLSDLPALCLIIACLALILFASERSSLTQSIFFIFLAGIAAYGAYNTRTIYLFTIVLLTLLIPTLAFKNSTTVRKTIAVLAFILGSAIAATPQALINMKHLSSPTPLVVSNINNSSLFANQLKWGITIQRYETGYDIKSGVIFPVFYLDPTGEELFRNHGIGNSAATVPGYFKILLSEPISFLKIYTKHFINGLDVRDDDTYTRIRSKENNLRSLASLSISIYGLFCLTFLVFRRSTTSNASATHDKIAFRLIWAAAIILPVIAIIPGAIETRFFLPLHLMAYCAIAFGLPEASIRSLSSTKKTLIAALYVTTVIAFYISASESISTPVYKIPKEYME